MLELDQIELAPGWSVHYETDEVGRTSLHVMQDQPDSHHPGERWLYGEYFWVDGMDDDEQFIRLYTTYQFLLIHEASEQVKYKGVAMFDQHRVPADIARIHDLIVTQRCLL